MCKIIIFILTIAILVSGCRDEKSSLNDNYLKIIDIITEDDFSLDEAKKAWDIYESKLFASVGFCSDPLMRQCVYIYGNLNQKANSMPPELQQSYKKLRTKFFEFLKCVRQYKVTDDDRRDLVCAAIEKAYENVLVNFFWNSKEFLDEELYKELSKDNSELSPYLCAYFYYSNRHKFNLFYKDYCVYIHTYNIYQTNNKDTKLIVLYNSDYQAELIFITYNKKTHEFKQIKTQEGLYFCNQSSEDHFFLNSQNNIFTIVSDNLSAQYVLDLKELKLKKR